MFNSWSKTWNKSRKLDPISYSWHACHAFNIFWHMHDCRKIIESFQKWIPVPRFLSIWNTVLNIMISFSYFTCIGPSDLGKMTWPWKISRQHHQFHSLCEFEVASVVPVDLCVSIVTTVYSWIHSYIFLKKKVFFVENVKSRIIFFVLLSYVNFRSDNCMISCMSYVQHIYCILEHRGRLTSRLVSRFLRRNISCS